MILVSNKSFTDYISPLMLPILLVLDQNQVEQVAFLGGSVQYQVRTSGGLSITAVAPKTGQRLPVGSDVDVAWPPTEALVLAGSHGDEEEAPA